MKFTSINKFTKWLLIATIMLLFLINIVSAQRGRGRGRGSYFYSQIPCKKKLAN